MYGTRAGLLLAVLLLAASGCRSSKATFGDADSGMSGTEPLTCTENADCAGEGICTMGVCRPVVPCQADDECEGVCHTTRGFCVECDGRHVGECAAGSTCQFDFTCVAIGSNQADAGPGDGGSVCTGACTTRDECGADQVCRGGTCCAPPPRCTTVEDCPASSPECNGATGLCFGGNSCLRDSDCSTQPGCTGDACRCDQPAAGQPGTCRVRVDECQADADCFDGGAYNGRFCTLTTTPKQCVQAPACADDVDCGNAGLVCDTQPGSASTGRCVNMACPTGNECAATQLCVDSVCIGANCVNAPGMCATDERCDMASGRCMPNQGNTCVMNTDCNQGFYCNTSAGLCLQGCRDAMDCPGGVCDAAHQCEMAAGGLCGSCATDTDCPTGTECVTNPITMAMQCREPCNMFTGQPCMIDPNATCLFVRCLCGM